MSGFFLTLEGGEGVGKTTQLRLLADALSASGRKVVVTREPGGTAGAEMLRTLLLRGDHGLALRSETLLHFAARIDHVERLIHPALAAGSIVLCDRFYDSTMAYQGFGLGRGDPAIVAFIQDLSRLVGLTPDLTLVLDAPRATTRVRIANRAERTDRYERLDEGFHERVANGFRLLTQADPARMILVAADRDAAIVHRELLHHVDQRLAA
jgi:dTMP kinase